MKWILFKPKLNKKPWGERLSHSGEILLKSVILVVVPIVPASLITLGWYRFVFERGIHFSEKAENLDIIGLIPTSGILYGLIFACMIGTVWGEYKTMRAAVKQWQFDLFMSLRDEEMSPLMHIIMMMTSAVLLGGFMGIHYPSLVSGECFVGVLSYLMSLFLLIVYEIDDPCSGLWFIKNIPEEWLRVDVDKYRADNCKKAREAFRKQFPDERALAA